MRHVFAEAPEVCDHTLDIADSVELDPRMATGRRPTSGGTTCHASRRRGGMDRDAYLRQLVDEGAAARYGEITPEIRERIDHELDVITNMGFGGYFLIVWDLIRHAREQESGWARGADRRPGRS